MSTENGKENGVQNAMLGWLIAPLAVLVALLADMAFGFGFVLDTDGMTPFAAIAIAATLGMAPRVMKDQEIIGYSKATLSLVTLVLALVLAEGVALFTESNLLGLVFFITMFGGRILDSNGRHEWNTILIFSAIGFYAAIFAAMDFAANQTHLFTLEGSEYDRTAAWQEAIGFIFFNVLTIFVVLGMLAAVLLRGLLTPATDKGWFGYIKPQDGLWNSKTVPLQIALAVWAASHMAVLYYFGTLSDLNILAIWSEDAYHGYVGFWPAALTGVVALICAWMAAERWYTRSLLIGSMWALYIVSSLYESGHWTNENLEKTWSVWIWFGVTFFIGVLIYWFATHENYGGWMNRELHEPSQARVFWSNHWAGIMIFTAFLVGLAIRVQWYLVPSMNSYGLDSWDLTGGSDPWYMKRVVDYVIAENAHLVWDADRNYPVGGINPRPPLFSWSMALGAMALSFLGIEGDAAVWYSMLALPAIFGAFIVFPMASIAKDHFGKGAGVVAAWLIAFMPTHVQKSTWAMADHDSFVLLFLTTAFMFYLRAVKLGGDERLSRNLSASPVGLLNAMKTVMVERRAASANAIAAGVCFGIVALGWKGFVYGPAIIFLAYFLQVAMNMFRRRDSTILNTLNILMLGTIFLMVLPFYAHPQLDLVLNSTGLQPLLFIAGFTLAITWITTGFRDKPWLLVLGTLFTGATVFFVGIYILQQLELSNAWEILTTGSGYFTKNKIFGTIAEASAPSRGQLFASFGPIIFVLAIVMGIIALWDGFVKKNANHLVLGMWVIVAAYMAWSAGRFLFNAAPAMAVMGSWGIVTLWRASGAGNMAKEWRRMGIRTPGERITNARKTVWRTPQFSAIGLVLLLILSQHATYGLDAAMPSSARAESEMDKTIYHIAPDIMRWDTLGFSLLDADQYDNEKDRWYLGSFGSGFNDQGWNLAYDWLSEQDTEQPYSDRPAFVSWWDYGFQALETGDHPSVSDNFQSGISATGNMLLARGEDDLTAMFIWRLSEGDLAYNQERTGERVHTAAFMNTLKNSELSDEQVAEFTTIQTGMTADGVVDRVFKVVKINDGGNSEVILTEGHPVVDGVADRTAPELYFLYEDRDLIPCTGEDGQSECSGDAFTSLERAEIEFDRNVQKTDDTRDNTTHYIVGDYWYTSDLIEEYDSVSTGMHRKNSGLALVTQLLTGALDSEDLHTLYSELMSNAIYSVQDHEGAPGEMITRDHEIRYFAVDNRLYPRGGMYSSDYSGGNPTGIFAAPTILSGQDFGTFMDEVYITKRGTITDEMTRDEFDSAMQQNVRDQQNGLEVEPLTLEDINVVHTAEFFDTMLARNYVGYGAPDLGFTTTEQPGQHFGQSGSPNTMMTNAVPMPGAMMNHFVIANWYDAEDPDNALGQANSLVKILKYYPGVEVSGSVTFEDDGSPMSNVRILLERDAFSGEDETDEDPDTYWIPIGYTDADENGDWSYVVPAGKIRATAYAGEYSDVAAKDVFRTGEYASGLGDLTVDTNDERETNLITSLLGKVANMSWMGEVTNNITGEQADREEDFTGNYDIVVDSSGVAGTVTWSGHESFEGLPVEGVQFHLRNIWDMTGNYTVNINEGSFTTPDGESRIVQGTGEVEFNSEGIFDTQGNVGIVRDFTGNYTRTVADARSYTTNATFDGSGTIVATWIDYDAPDCDVEENGNESETVLPTYEEEISENETVNRTHIACLTTDANTYLFSGEIAANGRMTADGVVTVTKQLDSETFEGSGIYVGIGTASGTGLFTGEGTFSGEMVEPGSFYETGLMPGTYNMIANFSGRLVLLPDPVEVGISPSNGLEMKLPGSIFEDTLYADYETDGAPTPLPDEEIEVTVFGSDDELISIMTDENGSFSYGPLAPGDYQWRVDIDDDGWYEREENFTVDDSSANVTLAVSVPTKRDITIQLDAGDSGLDLTNRTLTFYNTESTDLNPIQFTATSDENGVVYVEIDMGMWIISDESDETYVLWDEREVTSEDLSITLEYAISVTLEGTIWSFDQELLTIPGNDEPSDIEPDLLEGASNVLLEARSGNIILDTVTDDNGSFEIRLPAGKVFHLNADTFAGPQTLNAGMMITDASQITDPTNVNLYLVSTNLVQGTVWLRDSPVNGTGINWGAGVDGSHGMEVIATDADGLEWRTELDDAGTFTLSLVDGDWGITLSNEMMNADAVSVNTTNFSGQVDIVANPDNVTTTFRVFLDTSFDGVWENGTAVDPEFRIIAQDPFGIDVNVTSDMYDAVSGELNLSLSIGTYAVLLEADDPRDENASSYRLFANGLPGISLGLADSGEPIEIMLDPEYLVTGTVYMESGLPMANSTVWLYNEANDDFTDLVTDENGTFAKYVPQGTWIVEVDDYEADSGLSEIYRDIITIEDSVTDLSWTTETVMVVNLQLQEGLTDRNISSTRVTAVSLDGLGNVSLGPSDGSGMISELLMPGNWTLAMNRTDNLERWVIEEGVYNSEGQIDENGTWDAGIVVADKSVKVGGKVFWDLNEDDLPSSGEGIEGVNVTITGDNGVDSTLVTDEDGVWSLFVPIRENYTVVAIKGGFADVTFSDGNSSYYIVNDTHESRDFEMSAGMVSVSGNVTDAANLARLDGATITLVPASGIIRDSVTIEDATYENDTLSWSADILPGNWIVIVEGTDAGDNGAGLAIGLLEAVVQDGAAIDLVMESSGRLTLTSSWTNIEDEAKHAGDHSEVVEVEFDLGDGTAWMVEFDENGEIDIYLPNGEVDLDSEFVTEQRGLEMEYTAGVQIDIGVGVEDSRVLEFTRRVNSDLTIEVLSIEEGATYNESDLREMTAIEDDDTEGYEVITMKLGLTYEGTEISDVFTASAGVGVSQDADLWTIEFMNETGDWTSVMDVQLGIGDADGAENQILYTEVEVRITLPDRNDTRTYDDGHAINMRFAADGGVTEQSVRVNVPQQYEITIDELDEAIGIADGQTTLVTLEINNLGNGDDSVEINAVLEDDCVEAGWDVTPKTSTITIAAEDDRAQSFTIFASTNSTESECNVDFTVDSEGDIDTLEEGIEVRVSVADLEILTENVEPMGNDAVSREEGFITVPIRNNGFLSAEVIVYLEGNEGTDYSEKEITIVVPAGEVADASFPYDGFDPGTQGFKVRITVMNSTPVAESSEDSGDFAIKFSNVADGEESPFVMIVVVALVVLILFGGYKTARRGSGGRF